MNRLKPMESLNANGICMAARSATGLGVETRQRATMLRFLVMIMLVIAAVCGLQACGGGSSTTTTIKSVAITPASQTVGVNEQFFPFTAVVTLTDSTNSSTATVTWEVNGIAGGDLATVGSIVASADDSLEATYTAPPAVPTTTIDGVTQLGQVSVTAVATQTTTNPNSNPSGSVTSNVAIVTVGAGAGLTISPLTPTVAANQVQPFTALFNGQRDLNATFSVTPSGNAAVYGSIDNLGNYTAPLSPPPGGTVTVTATDPAATAPATATVTITYSDASLSGQYAFSYSGNDQSGFLAVAGSFATDGKGTILSGVEDVDSFLTGVKVQVPISGFYTVTGDGRGFANISTTQGAQTWRFALTTNHHAQITLFNATSTGGGTIDQQSLNALSSSSSVINGPYVFNVLGADKLFNPLGMAGKFSADGAGNIPSGAQPNTILDINDNGIAVPAGIVTSNTSLAGSYLFDPLFPGTGRGTLTLTSGPTGTRQYAFYAAEGPAASVTHLYLVEIDNKAFVAGDMYAAPAGSTPLTTGNYVFTAGGNAMIPVANSSPVLGSFASGGVFTSNGTTGVSGGIFDANNGGTYNNGPTINSCSSYSTDPTTGRIDLKLFTGSGACPALPNSGTSEFAVYQTSQGTALMLEIDPNALSTGMAYQQCVPPAAACSASVALLGGSLATGLIGQGVFHNSPSSYQPDASGQISFSGTGITGGNLDINNFGSVSPTDPIAASGNSIAAPAANGRGTAVLAVTTPVATFNLIYYLIDENTALLFDRDATPIATGILARQF